MGQITGIEELSLFNQLNKPAVYLQGWKTAETLRPNLAKELLKVVQPYPFSGVLMGNDNQEHLEHSYP